MLRNKNLLKLGGVQSNETPSMWSVCTKTGYPANYIYRPELIIFLYLKVIDGDVDISIFMKAAPLLLVLRQSLPELLVTVIFWYNQIKNQVYERSAVSEKIFCQLYKSVGNILNL